MSGAVLVPVKDHSRAKSRLSQILGPDERGRLAWAMLEDLIAALSALSIPIAMVTDSPKAAARARALSWRVIWESRQRSESASVDEASQLLAREGVDGVLCIPADIPLIRSEDVTDLLMYHINMPLAAIAPSRDRTGTNALLRSPPALFPSRFGPGSFPAHMNEARNAGAGIRIVENPRLALDLDEPGDVVLFLERRVPTHTYRTLMELNFSERVARHAVARNPDPGAGRNT